jgi:extracellular factor (EF) 3-hydroxypalmitic acid methyl ester biosynthesis protein
VIAEAQRVLRGTLEKGAARHPIRVDRADAHSLIVSFDDRGALPTGGVSHYDQLTLSLNGQTLQLGSCTFDAQRRPARRSSDPPPEPGDGRIFFDKSIYDFRLLLRNGRISELSQRVRHLPVLLSRQGAVDPVFRSLVSRVLYDLQVFRALFDELDRNLLSEPAESREQVREVAVEQHFDAFCQFFDERLRELHHHVRHDSREVQSLHGFFLRKQVWDLIATSEFLLRTNLKPRGYAGDSEMMRMVYENGFRGASVFARFMHRHPLVTPAAQAVRNRCQVITEALARRTKDIAGRRVRVLSVACGPAFELRSLLTSPAAFERYELVLLDQDVLALEHAQQTVTALEAVHGAQVPVELRRDSVRTMLSGHHAAESRGTFDFIYSMGMFDYLTRPVARAVLSHFYSQLKPGGTLLVGNYHPENPTRTYMEYWMDWVLCYRDEQELMDLALGLPGAECSITMEASRSQLFLEVKRT